jgi:hypothetical protein
MLTYNINKNGKVSRTIKAKGMNSIYNQFNTAKKKGATFEYRTETIGHGVWVLPNGDVLELVKA